MDEVLHIKGLTKRYGSLVALNDLNLDVEKGSVFGLLGPNGSGKTTTLGIILGVRKANAGSFSWFGQPPSNKSRKRIGAILETPNFYSYLSAENNLKIVADIKGVAHTAIEEVLQLTGLIDRKDDKFKNYSLGMKQRLALASAMLGNPEVLVLDEPTNGLDPQGIAEVRDLIIEIAAKGTTIILASHILDEVEKVCTHVGVLKRGEILVSGMVSEVLADTDVVELKSVDLPALGKVIGQYPGIESARVEGEKVIARFSDKVNGADINKYLQSKGIMVSHLVVKKKSLEKQFLEIVK